MKSVKAFFSEKLFELIMFKSFKKPVNEFQVPISSISHGYRHAGTYRDMRICPANVLADTLTLFKPRETDYARQLSRFFPN